MSYKQLEDPLKLIHKRFVSLDESDVNEAKLLVRKIIFKMASYMKEEDALFKELFNGLYFGGSFYHNLKIQNPDEFDIDFLLHLPKCKSCKIRNCGCVEIGPSPVPGFLFFKMKKAFSSTLQRKFCRNGYVQSNLVYNWMKSLIYKALNRFKKDKQITTISQDVAVLNNDVTLYTECSPALKICIKNESRTIYIDLAAAFKLEPVYWPTVEYGYKKNPTQEAFFSIVPFSPKEFNYYWRPSFQAQEKEIISGKERLKPALRLLKIMKTNLNHKVSSYVLKTLILEEAEKYEWKNMSLAQTFMMLFQKYIDCLREGWVRYYWNDKVNLLDYIKKNTLVNHCNEMNNLYEKVQREYEANPIVVAEIILKRRSDYEIFKRDWTIIKNHRIQVHSKAGVTEGDRKTQTWDLAKQYQYHGKFGKYFSI